MVKQTIWYQQSGEQLMTLTQHNKDISNLLPYIHSDASYGTNLQTSKSTFHTRMNHLAIKEGFMYNNLSSGAIKLLQVLTNENLTNFLMKAFNGIKLKAVKLKFNLICH
jgi:hypothetical protein